MITLGNGLTTLRLVWERQMVRLSASQALALSGTIWTFVLYGGTQVLRIGSNLLATRLLFPELFGLMALVNALLLGLKLFSDVGLSVSIVRHPRGEQQSFLRTAYSIQIFRGFAIWVICCMAAPSAAAFYNDPRLVWLVPLVGFSAVINGFNSTSIYLLRRRVNVRTDALLEIVAQAAGVTVMLLWAWISPSVLALAAFGLTSSAVLLIGSHQINRPHRDRPGWDRAAASDLLNFGKWILVSTAFLFLASQADRLLLGKLYSFEFLGIYSIALALAETPRALLMAGAAKVIFPMLSLKANIARDELVKKVSRLRFRLLVLSAFGIAVIAGFGDQLVYLLYDERYAQAAWMMQILAAGVWVSFLFRTVDSVLYVAGRAALPAMAQAASFFFLVAAVFVGDWFAGPFGAVLGIALSPIPHYIVIAPGLRQQGFWFVRQDLAVTALFSALLASILAIRSLVGPYPAVLVKLAEVTS